MNVRGMSTHRLKDNEREKAFADWWVIQGPRTLPWLLGNGRDRGEVSDRDALVAATLVQWLGSPVGSALLFQLLEENPVFHDYVSATAARINAAGDKQRGGKRR